MAKTDHRGRKVKILATLGPASRSPEMIERLLDAGADAFRVNMSHGDHATHAETIANIRAAEKAFGRPIAILCDLQGPKLRVGTFAEGKVLIRHGAHFTLDRDPTPGTAERVCLPHPELFGVLQKGQRLLIDDGKLRLRVIRAEAETILCTAEVGGFISDRKGVNVPDAVVPVPALTEKDRRDLAFAVEHHADWIALSFVQRPEDVAEARKLMGGYGALVAKIEKPAALDRLEEIIELADGIMVARAEQRRADPQMGGAQHDGGLEIVAHAHAAPGQPVIGGELVEQGEERRRLDPRRGHAHQSGQRQAGGARLRQQTGQIGDRAAALLLLRADVDLHETGDLPPRLVHRPGERRDERGAVERMDAIKQRHRVIGLVRLQLADEVQGDVAVSLAQRRPLGLGFLHAVFTEQALSSLKQRNNLFGRMRLADGDERDSRGITAGELRGMRDARADLFQEGGWLFHRLAL